MNPSRVGQRLSARTFRWVHNLSPPMWSTGVKVTRISPDYLEWDLVLRRRLRNLNYMGTMFGGAIYASADPQFVLAFLQILGPDYVVWSKQATVTFRRPGRSRLHAAIRIDPQEPEAIRAATKEGPCHREYQFRWLDSEGNEVATIDHTLYFRRAARQRAGNG